ncbi:hypothetical protein BT96DRAFT_985308 [Gymnopus androsaceus JB14]|uniref:SET domain-containing protein n=1 Tax=Gymnopus androsaceus JB14 TaxID=1447944 RepID=A0A6A4IKF3_9AGAR|nr:hypothetical protein BT96DRAFT_985308 [Gymnopus androsaceus JB14]
MVCGVDDHRKDVALRCLNVDEFESSFRLLSVKNSPTDLPIQFICRSGSLHAGAADKLQSMEMRAFTVDHAEPESTPQFNVWEIVHVSSTIPLRSYNPTFLSFSAADFAIDDWWYLLSRTVMDGWPMLCGLHCVSLTVINSLVLAALFSRTNDIDLRAPNFNSVSASINRDCESNCISSATSKCIPKLFDRMLSEDQKAFATMADSHEYDGSGPLLGRFRTNGHGTNKLRDKAAPQTTFGTGNTSSISVGTYTIRDIPPGTEITFSYCDPLDSAAKLRQVSRSVWYHLMQVVVPFCNPRLRAIQDR